MARLRTTVLLRNVEGLKAKIRARTQRQRARLKAAATANMEDERELARVLCPKDTEWMVEHIRAEPTREGFNYFVGFFAADFVGQMNTNVTPPRLITVFYPDFVVRGTRFQAGNDFLREVRRIMRPVIRERNRNALRAGLS